MINVGVVGCGYWGPNLIRNFVTCPETELVWACDLDEKRLEKVLRPYPGVRKTTRLKDILADEGVNAIAIATPVHTHFPIGKACLESCKHVLVEKPLASSVVQGEELVNLAEKNNLRPIELKEPVAIVKKIAENDLLRSPIIAAERAYLSYLTDGRQLYVPYADYEALVKYCQLNNIDFLYLKHSRVNKYPFFKTFSQNSPPSDFVLLYSGVDAYGGKIELYRFRGNKQRLSSS